MLLGRKLQVSGALLHTRVVPARDAAGADRAVAAGRIHVQLPRAQEEKGEFLSFAVFHLKRGGGHVCSLNFTTSASRDSIFFFWDNVHEGRGGGGNYLGV